MDARDFVPMVLLAMNGEIHGKTKLQKTVFFLGLLTENLEDLGYRAHFYGPYSEAVADAVAAQRSLKAKWKYSPCQLKLFPLFPQIDVRDARRSIIRS